MREIAPEVHEQSTFTSPLPPLDFQDINTGESNPGFYGAGVDGYTDQFQLDGMSLDFDSFTEAFNWVRCKATTS